MTTAEAIEVLRLTRAIQWQDDKISAALDLAIAALEAGEGGRGESSNGR